MIAAPPASQPTGLVLRDIHAAPPPSWWPPAPGWWLLVVLIVVAVSIGVWWWRRARRRARLERAVLAEVDALLASSRQQPQVLATGLHQLLRRAALRLDARAVQQQGDHWRRTLAQVPVDAPTLDQLMSLETAMYRPDAVLDADTAAHATRRWLQLAWRARPTRALAKEVGHD